MSFAFAVRLALPIKDRRTRRARGVWLRRATAALAILAALGAAGCQSGSDDLFGPPDDGGEQASVRFTHDGVLELEPGQTVTVDISTNAGAKVGVLLLGDAFDASLDRTTARADSNGHASVELRAPSQPSTFRLRAQVGDVASAELSVAVSDGGFAAVRVVPSYDGKRVLDEWIASVTVGSTCDSVLAAFPLDPPGALSTTSDIGTQPIVSSVPVGPVVAVAIRSGSLVAGCVQTALSSPGETVDVSVDVLDRPMQLGDAELDVTLGFSTTDPAYAALIDEGTALVAETAFPPTVSASTLLLDAMMARITDPDDLAAFLALRSQSNLDESIGTELGSFHPFDVCSSFSADAKELATSDAASTALTIEGRLSGSAENPAAPTFLPSTFAGLDASELSIPTSLSMSWSTTPNDGLVIGGELPFSPTALASHFMNQAAADASGPGVTVSSLVAAGYDCGAIAYSVGDLPSCDVACVETLCLGAIDDLWARGTTASDDGASPSGALSISISGTSTVDADVLPVDLTGTWVGSLDGLSESLNLSGAASGVAPPPG